MENNSKPSVTDLMAGLQVLDEIMTIKKEIANKIRHGYRLLDFEKELVCAFLGEAPPTPKKGRPTTIRRDIELTLEFLCAKEKNDLKSNVLRDKLIKKYGLPSKRENTFYTALKRGIHELKSLFTNPPKDADDNSILVCKKVLELIDQYKSGSTSIQ